MTRPSTERFERLVRDLHAPVFRSARRMCSDDSAAADVVQEVFTRVWTGKVRLDRAENERAMLCWLAARLAANAKRAATRRARHEETAMQRTDRSTTEPFDDTTRVELHRVTAQLVDELPETLRVPLLMRHQDDLTLAAIGTALALPTSTVHDRIQQALERLRSRLAGRGPAIALAALPRLVASLDVAPSPSGLEAQLLALPKVVPAVASATKGFVGLVAVAVVSIGIAIAASRGDDAPRTEPPAVVASVLGDAPQDPPSRQPIANDRQPATPVITMPAAAAPAAQDPAQPPAVLATFTGTVRDAEAWPVVGATVKVVAGGGYKSFELGPPATTDDKGAFTIRAEASWLQPRAVRLVVTEKGRSLMTTGDLAVPRPADARPLDLVLPASAGTETSRFELAIDVRDEAGLVLPGVTAHLYAATEPAPRPGWDGSEGSAETAANGQAVLAGRGLGAKWLFVDGRPLHRESSFAKITVEKPGPRSLQVVLRRGGELAVVVKTVSGRELEWSKPWVIDESTGLQFDCTAENGTFRFRGLTDGPHTVMASGDGQYSLAAKHGVRPAVEPVVLTLKDSSDERDVGDHLAELHGELVDATTGEVIEFGAFAIDVMPVIADGSSLASDGIEPPAPAQRAGPSGKFRRFHETGLAPGRHAIVVDVPGYASSTPVFDLRANEVRTGIRIVLQKQAVVRGRVVGANGEPVKGASLFAIGTGPLADRLLEAWRAHRDRDEKPGDREVSFTPVRGWSQDDGAFTVGRVPAGVPLRLVARNDDHGLVVLPLPALEPGREIADFEIRFGR